MSVTCALGVGHVWISLELFLVIGCFKEHRIAYLRMSLLLPPVTLQPFPHIDLHNIMLALPDYNLRESLHAKPMTWSFLLRINNQQLQRTGGILNAPFRIRITSNLYWNDSCEPSFSGRIAAWLGTAIALVRL
jgi:hypothetical protein